jgi:hypothetical protein
MQEATETLDDRPDTRSEPPNTGGGAADKHTRSRNMETTELSDWAVRVRNHLIAYGRPYSELTVAELVTQIINLSHEFWHPTTDEIAEAITELESGGLLPTSGDIAERIAADEATEANWQAEKALHEAAQRAADAAYRAELEAGGIDLDRLDSMVGDAICD